jgi:hypothetical protein
MKPSIGRQECVSWKALLSGLLSACLLLPVPVFAIDFTGVTWTKSDPDGFFAQVLQSSNTTDSILTVTPAGGGGVGFLGNGIYTLSAQITMNAGDTLKANWSNLSAIDVTGGTLRIEIGANSANNMFDQSYNGAPPSPPNPSITSFTNTTGTTTTFTVTVTFDATNGGSGITLGPQAGSTSFTLDFHN